ncbi:hypothetical protein BHE74_00046501 [Ensete ventricosum]|nr:hypothetical protein BHE74_00046501 [Ensete ventricosum]RZS20168.1 hypothetical protein BHM03_00052652 [Ensete ventricosum]
MDSVPVPIMYNLRDQRLIYCSIKIEEMKTKSSNKDPSVDVIDGELARLDFVPKSQGEASYPLGVAGLEVRAISMNLKVSLFYGEARVSLPLGAPSRCYYGWDFEVSCYHKPSMLWTTILNMGGEGVVVPFKSLCPCSLGMEAHSTP